MDEEEADEMNDDEDDGSAADAEEDPIAADDIGDGDGAATEASLVDRPLFSVSLSSSPECREEERIGIEVEVLEEMDD